MTVTITVGEKQSKLEGKITPHVIETASFLPGKKKWKEGSLYFETSRYTIEFFKKHFPDATFVDRAEVLEELAHMREVEEAAKEVLAQEKFDLPDFQFKLEPRQHQIKGFEVCKDREFFGIFFDQGTGKTKLLLDIAAYKYCKGEIEALLVFAYPSDVPKQWFNEEIPKHMSPAVDYVSFLYKSGMTKEQNVQYNKFLRSDGLKILCVHIEALQGETGTIFAEHFLEKFKSMMVIDEASCIRNWKAKRTKTAIGLGQKAVCRFIGTGTPVIKGAENYYSQFEFLKKGVLGFNNFYSFMHTFCQLGGFEGKQIIGTKNEELLKHRIAPHCMFVSKKDCYDLPEKNFVQKSIELTDEQRRAYSDMKEYMFTILNDEETITVQTALTQVMKLQQIACGFIMQEEGEFKRLDTNRPKYLSSLFEQSPHKYLIFCNFKADAIMIQEEFNKKKIPYLPHTGFQESQVRSENRKKFRESENDMFLLCSYKTSSRGLNLQGICDTLIYYSHTYEVEDRWQSEDRIHRDGMGDRALYLELSSPGTLDAKLLRNVKSRREVARNLQDVKDLLVD